MFILLNVYFNFNYKNKQNIKNKNNKINGHILNIQVNNFLKYVKIPLEFPVHIRSK